MGIAFLIVPSVRFSPVRKRDGDADEKIPRRRARSSDFHSKIHGRQRTMWKTERIPDTCENDARIRKVLSALGARPRRDRKDQWAANCPAHGGDSWKLDITLTPDAVFLLTCRSRGCSCNDICRAAGLHPADLFPPGRNGGNRPPLLPLSPTAPTPQPTARRANPSPDIARDHRRLVESPAVMAFLTKNYLPGCAMDDVISVPWGCMKGLVFPDGTVHDAIIYFSDYSDAVTAKSLDRNAKGKRWSMYLAGDASTLWEVFGGAEDDTAALCGGQEKAWAVRCCTGMNAFSLNGEGMNLKESHLAQLRERGAKRVIVINDADETGRRGTERAVKALEAAGFEVAVPVWEDGLKEGFDVNDLVLRDGREGLKRFVLGAPFLHPWDKSPWASALINGDAWGSYRQPSFLVDGFLTEGSVNLFFGASGCLKSMMLLDLCAHVAAGRPWLGHNTRKTPVIWINIDNPDGVLFDRLRALRETHGFGTEDFQVLNYPLPRMNLLDSADIVKIKWMVERWGTGLVALDCFQSSHNGDAWTEEAGRVLYNLREVIGGGRLVINVIHHENKQGGARGSSSIDNLADTVYHVERPDMEADVIRVSPLKCRHGSPRSFRAEFRYSHRPGTGGPHEAPSFASLGFALAELSDANKREDRKDRMLSHLRKGFPAKATQQELAEAAGITNRATAAAVIAEMEKDGLVTLQQGQNNSKLVSITGRGREHTDV